jgi:hypothetical protein
MSEASFHLEQQASLDNESFLGDGLLVLETFRQIDVALMTHRLTPV